MSETLRVVIADDHTLVRQSIAKMLTATGDIEVVAEAATGRQAVDLVRIHRPDVAILDVSMPDMDGLDAAEAIRKDPGDVCIVMLTMHDDDATLRRASALAVDAYVAKTATTDDVVTAVRTVAEGRAYISPDVAMRMMRLASGARPGNADLTQREVEILAMLATGSRVQEIADELFLSVRTVKNHLSSIYTKMDVETAAQAVAEAYRSGIVATDS